MDISAEVRPLEGLTCLVVQEEQIVKKCGGGRVGWEGWNDKGCMRVHVNRVWHGRFMDDTERSGV